MIVLGVDGLDWKFVDAHRDQLPTLASWPVLAPLRSIFPPDSIPAWTTIFTGVPPGDHGYLDSIDYLDKKPEAAATSAAEGLPGRTFWDRAGEAGQSVCVINPFLAYPAWDVNGVMIAGPVFVDGTASITGTTEEELPQLPQLGGIVTFPTARTMGPFVEDTLQVTEEQARFGLTLLDELRPDLFFITILTVDRLQHFAWRFADPDDPTYPGPNPHQDAVLRSYQQIDRLAGEYANRGPVVILSDHGHGMRCRRMVYVDELLRREGLVHETTGRVRLLSRTYLLERAKKVTLHAAYRLSAEELAYKLGRRLPNRKAIKYSSFSSDEDSSLARLSRTFGRNQHSGVELSVDTPENRARVVDALEELRDPQTGSGVLEWVRERESVVSGARVERYPEILFKLKEGYGVDFGLYGGLFGPDVNHRRISGGHKPDGVLASSVAVEDPPSSIEGFYAFVLSMVGAGADSPRQ
jgi:hypothetical protein